MSDIESSRYPVTVLVSMDEPEFLFQRCNLRRNSIAMVGLCSTRFHKMCYILRCQKQQGLVNIAIAIVVVIPIFRRAIAFLIALAPANPRI